MSRTPETVVEPYVEKLQALRTLCARGTVRVDLLKHAGCELGYVVEIQRGSDRRWTFRATMLEALLVLEENTRDMEAGHVAA